VAAEPAREHSPSVHSREYIPALDGIRGIAALAVFFHHALFTAIDPPAWPAVWQPLIAFSHAGQYGLDLFFVLSGYLITSILITNAGSPNYYKDFYIDRFTRIIPLYIVMLAIVAVFVHGSRGYVILSAFFIANFAQLFHVSAVGPFWTLAIEEQFYLLWPWLARACSIDRLRYLTVIILGVEPILRLADIAIGHHNFQLTFFHADGLAFGALLACQRRRGDLGKLSIVLAIGAMIYALSLHRFAILPFNDLFEALRLSSVSLMAYGIVALAVGFRHSRLARWLAAPTLIFVGRISYGLYLIHLYVFLAFDAIFGPGAGIDPGYLATRFLVALIVTTVFCILSRKFIERPALRLRRPLKEWLDIKKNLLNEKPENHQSTGNSTPCASGRSLP